MKKIIFGLSLLALSSFAFAGAKNASPAKSETKSFSHTYYVTADLGSTYEVSPNPPAGGCQGGSDPCEIRTDLSPTNNQLQKTQVNNPSLAEIIETQDL